MAIVRNSTGPVSSHQGEKASLWRENQAANSVAVTMTSRRFPKRRCSFSKCATCCSRACWRCLYSSEGERSDRGTEVLSLTLCASSVVGYAVAALASTVFVSATREYHLPESFTKRRCVGKSTKTMPKRCV